MPNAACRGQDAEGSRLRQPAGGSMLGSSVPGAQGRRPTFLFCWTICLVESGSRQRRVQAKHAGCTGQEADICFVGLFFWWRAEVASAVCKQSRETRDTKNIADEHIHIYRI